MNALNVIPAKLRKPLLFAFLGGAGALLGELIAEPWYLAMNSETVRTWFSDVFARANTNDVIASSIYYLVQTPIATAFVATGFSVFLMIGQNLYLRRGIATLLQLVTSILGGLLSGWVAGFMAELMFQIALRSVSGIFAQECLRVIAWVIFGILTASGLSLIVPNLRFTRAIIGGVVGGFMGAVAFILVLYILQWLGGGAGAGVAARLIGMPVIGACIGAMIAIAEMLLSSANLEVGYGAAFTDSRVIPLGPSPLRIGSDRERCAVVRKDLAPIALEYRFVNGKILLHDVATGSTQTITPGHSLALGAMIVRIAGGAAQPSVAMAQPLTPNLAVPRPPTMPMPMPMLVPPRAAPSTAATVRLRRRDGQIVVVTEGTPVRNPQVQRDGNGPFAELARNPKDPSVLGLRNLSGADWQIRSPQGQPQIVPVGKSVRVAAGTTIEQGSVMLVIM